MTQTPDSNGGRLAQNIVHFARTLRKAGLPVGPGQVAGAIEAVAVAGLSSRTDFYWTLHSHFITAREQREIFDQTFHVFWRRRALIGEMMALMLPEVKAPPGPDAKPRSGARRVSEALAAGLEPKSEPRGEEIVFDMGLTFSDQEVLKTRDFEQMTAAEQAAAKQAMARMMLSLSPVRSRRLRSGHTGERIDLRASLRAALKAGGEPIELRRRARRLRLPPLVVICDISGSMESYTRMLLHFLHALTRSHAKVSTFLFGTRLTNITRRLKARDVDEALAAVTEDVADWAGGTRIGECLEAFNKDWARRVLAQGAHVLLVTDGLDRGDIERLERECARLHRSCRRLIWLNPLLRYDGFEAKARGVRAILGHVDEFRPCHNLNSLEALVEAFGSSSPARFNPRSWLNAA